MHWNFEAGAVRNLLGADRELVPQQQHRDPATQSTLAWDSQGEPCWTWPVESQRCRVSQECLILCPGAPHGSSITKTQVNVLGKGPRTQLRGWQSQTSQSPRPTCPGLSCPFLAIRWGHGTSIEFCSGMGLPQVKAVLGILKGHTRGQKFPEDMNMTGLTALGSLTHVCAVERKILLPVTSMETLRAQWAALDLC